LTKGHRALAVQALQVVDQPWIGMGFGIELEHRAELQMELGERRAQHDGHRMPNRALAA